MGVKASSLMWCEYNGSSVLPRDDKPASYFYCYKVPPPSYNHNWTDLHYAASHGNIRRIHEIIHKTGTVNIDRKDYYGKTPLYWAAYKGHVLCVEELIKFGASVNTKCRHGGTPLHAVVSLYPECALILIKNGADVNISDNWGVTPMHLAASSGQIDVIRYLVAAGAQLSFKNLKTGDIPKELLKHKEFCDRLITMSRNPPSLQQLCRVKIRYQLGTSPIQKLHDLKMPRQLKDFVSLKEFD
ncbi:serine/threonine-protein phosphatase 6 regulatory ankyrin repeat subunit B-like [Ruditapes philippinarum]|uniref:serine/threonine-protein phosphatase 6 regulatory ankyrin repeat subunit B-like n=1 Tax=Ruditapes philippinarum TaxID=129788 RepID=UPI00295A5F0C|nr:serine/threonine-protein phosphatase 6 regulatory ankyrin repeat subunit B-like [Ruditapes philippinarum]XP_060600878.1 serine/threonine-protein phosphatase 6 regulatory ankyrin repeat subunit B-like [Ruditapes philippinarum]